ncbi:Sec14p-like phosphatidylinositol transfer family protein [Quillaja saponaria]|uniref:Sec14p-like phosphatidylinositol transfer family protein n=1 Tax=Quillaja saponaria TaxID=32244 RepID=A0AAD7P8P0_QUISA|nr:Sec14p-like phosphatidylinositol transfer family protein [Quillaja saponaria]
MGRDSITKIRHRSIQLPGTKGKCAKFKAQRIFNHQSEKMALRLCQPLLASKASPTTTIRLRRFSVQSCIVDPIQSRKLVLSVKEKLEKELPSLPVGKNGRDDEDMILRFLKDRKFSVEEAVSKLTKAIKWRQEFGVSKLSEEAVKHVAQTGKACVHDFLDVTGRPVLIVVASKHFHSAQNPAENEKLCVLLIEKALRKLPPGKEQILVLFDLRGFGIDNADLTLLTFVLDVFYYYYPKRLGQVLLVEAPFVFEPFWQLAKPLLKSYASLVRFCSVETVRLEYFTEATMPASFRG